MAFCRREISSRHTNFEFYPIKENNPAYDRFITTDDGGLFADNLEGADGTFDLVTAFSVSTHLGRAEAEAMLRTVWIRLAFWGILPRDPTSKNKNRRRSFKAAGGLVERS